MKNQPRYCFFQKYCVSLHSIYDFYRMMNIITKIAKINRLKYSKGFGVHSPWVYRFIRYVLNENYAYYCYNDLKAFYPHLKKRTRKNCELYFRLANFRQPKYIIDYGSPNSAYSSYMKEGCKNSLIVQIVPDDNKIYQDYLSPFGVLEMVRMNLTGNYQAFYEECLKHVDNKSMMIVENIYKGKDERAFWKAVINDDRTGITFDLFECGIIFFDKSRYKKNYIINF